MRDNTLNVCELMCNFIIKNEDISTVPVTDAVLRPRIHLGHCLYVSVKFVEPQRQKTYLLTCAFAQSDQNLHCPHFEQSGMQRFYVLTTKTLLRLRGCAGSFESTLSACQTVTAYILVIVCMSL